MHDTSFHAAGNPPKIARFSGAGDPNTPGAWACTDDWDRFNTDFTEEIDNIKSDVASGALDNLPNGGKAKNHN